MPSGHVVIGSAEYDLLLNVAPLRAAFQQAEKDAAAATAKIASETKKIEGALNKVKTQQTINLTVDTRGGDAAIKQVQARLAAIKDETVNLTIKGQGADQALGKLKADIAAVENRGITLKVKTQETLGGAARPATTQAPIKIPVTLDPTLALASERKLKAELDSLKRQTTVPIKAESTQADATVARVKREIGDLTRTPAVVKVRAQQEGGSAGSVIGGLKTGIGAGLGIAGVTLGVEAVHAALEELVKTTIKADQAQKALNVTYGEAAPLYNKIAKDQAAAVGAATQQVQAAVTQFATLRMNYGLTSDQIAKLTKLTLDYAAVSGKDVVDVAQRLQSALRGEAESAEALGLTLNSDAVKATANMTAEQRKNFETLDQVTKAQIIYNELLRQSANIQGAAGKQAESLSGQVSLLAASWENLVTAFGKANESTFIKIARGARELTDELRKLVEGSSELTNSRAFRGVAAALEGRNPLPLTRQAIIDATPQRIVDSRANDEGLHEAEGQAAKVHEIAVKAAQEQESIARTTIQNQIKAWEEGSKAEVETIRERIQAVQDQAGEERQAIEDKRDQDISAVQAAADAEIQALDARKQAAADYYASQIDAVSKQRDADIAGIESRKEAALRGIEAERKAVEEARRGEDRALEARRDAERSAIEANTAAGERFFEQEKRGIESVRDTALRALDERAEAEDRRHDGAMRNLDEEEQRQLGVIDDQLRALDRQEEKERRAETDRGLKRDLDEAKRRLKTAKTPEEKRSAKNDVGRAEAAIAKEKRARERADIRAGLRDKQDAIRKEFDQRKKGESDQHKQVKDGIEDEKDGIKARTKVELDALAERLDAFKGNQKAQLDALADRYKEEDRIREDARRAEDQVFDDRKQKIEDDSKAEIEGVRKAADARIEALRTAARESDRFFDAEKRKSQDAAQAKIADIRRVADFRLRQLAAETRAMVRELNQQIKEHERAAARMVQIWKDALQNIKGFVRAELRVQYFQGSSGSTTQQANELRGDERNQGRRQFTDTSSSGTVAGTYDSRTGTFYDLSGREITVTDEQRRRILTQLGIPARALGGSAKAGQPYLVGEHRRPELFVPSEDGQILDATKTAALMGPEPSLLSAGYAAGAQRGWDGASSGPSYASHASTATTVNATFNIDAAGQNGEQLAREIAGRLEPLLVAKAVQGTVRLLDQTEKMHAEGVDRRLGGAT